MLSQLRPRQPAGPLPQQSAQNFPLGLLGMASTNSNNTTNSTDTDCSQAVDTLDCLRQISFELLLSSLNQTPNIFSFSSLGNVRINDDILTNDPYISLSRGMYT
ncbi:hypothetical protein C8J57DRAFT_57022 [Mycena rebaudengoi]|nr:hypothetical protein C8J57DRAFT_57022 [Mycena rebaudengoi]